MLPTGQIGESRTDPEQDFSTSEYISWATRSQKMDLTVSIVNTNNRPLLKGCLESVFMNSPGISLEVYVVDNNSDDGSVEMVRSRFPQVKLIRNDEIDGFAANHNKVLRRSQGRYVCILNEDTLIYTRTFNKMIAFMDHHPDVGAIGPQILNGDGITIQLECARRFPTLYSELCRNTGLTKWFPQSKLFGGVLMGYWDHNDTREVDSLSGACMMVRASTMREIGLLDERFFMYNEDDDWSYRIQKARWRVFFLHEAQILHYGGRTNEREPRKMGVETFRSQYMFFEKHHGSPYAWVYRLLIFFITLVKLLVFSAVSVVSRGSRQSTYSRDKISSHALVLKWVLTS